MELTGIFTDGGTDSYRQLLEHISGTYTEGRVRAMQAASLRAE